MHTVTQFHQTFDTRFGGGVQLRLYHATVLPEVDFPIHHGIGVILHIWVCRDRSVDGLAVAQIRQLRFLIGAANVLDGIVELIGQFQTFDGFHGEILPAILGVF